MKSLHTVSQFTMDMFRSLVLAFVVFLFSSVSISGCDGSSHVDPGDDTPPDTTTWLPLGLESMAVIKLRLFDPYLYAAISSISSGGLWRLDLRTPGSSWQALGQPITDHENDYIVDIAVHPDKSDWIMISMSGLAGNPDEPKLFRSMNAGASWIPVGGFREAGLSEFPRLKTLTTFADRVLADGRIETKDFGESWQLIYTDVEISQQGVIPNQIVSRHPSLGDYLWSAGMSGFGVRSMGYTLDGGNTWILIALEEVSSAVNAKALALDPFDAQVVYASVPSSPQDRVLFKTTDRGMTWMLLDTEQEVVNIRTLLHHPEHSGRLWAIGWDDSRIITTRDGGLSWQTIKFQLPAESAILDLIWDDAMKAIMLATSQGVYRYLPEP